MVHLTKKMKSLSFVCRPQSFARVKHKPKDKSKYLNSLKFQNPILKSSLDTVWWTHFRKVQRSNHVSLKTPLGTVYKRDPSTRVTIPPCKQDVK